MRRWFRRIVIAALLLAVAAGVFFECTTHIGRGWLFNEPFYDGRPASYWAIEIERWETQNPDWETQTYVRRSTWPNWVERMLPTPTWPGLLDGDPDGLSVLQALRKHPSTSVQDWARIGIERMDNGERGEIKIRHPSVIVTAELYEVDAAFHDEVAKGKWRSTAELEEMERKWLAQLETEPAGKPVIDPLAKAKVLLPAKEVKIELGKEETLLSLTKETTCLPSPAQVRKGQTARQVITEGVVLRAQVNLTFDRRFVRVRLIEKHSELEGIDKTLVLLDNNGTTAPAEIPCLKESTFSALRNTPDGATMFVPLQYWSADAKERGRWLVVRIVTRIYIEAEERRIREEASK